MSKWSPPKIFVHRQPDGTTVVVDETGNLVATPPTLKYVPTNGESKYLDPWGNEISTYQLPDFSVHRAPDGSVYAVDEFGTKLATQPVLQSVPGAEEGSLVAVLADGSTYEPSMYRFPEEFFVHTAADGTMTAVDASGTPLPTQPQLSHGYQEEGPIAALSDGSMYVPAPYEFPKFFVHTAADGTMMAVDAAGVPLPTQPQLAHWGPEAEPVAAMPDGSKYTPEPYEFPSQYFVHTAVDGSMTAVDASGTPLPIQPQLTHSGPEGQPVAARSDGSMYQPPTYQFPREFSVHTAADGTMTAVDASGTPLPTQPQLTHWGPEGEPVATMPDGSAYTPKPLYPPSGEAPEEWPPETETGGTGGEPEEESEEPMTEAEETEGEIAGAEEMMVEGYADELLTAGLLEPATAGEPAYEAVPASSSAAAVGGGEAVVEVGDLPIPVPQPESAVTEVPSEAALDGKGADVVTIPEMKWDEAQEQTLEGSPSAMDPDPVDMDPDPITREGAETAIEQAAGRAATEVVTAADLGGRGVVPEMKLGETQADAVAGKWAGVEPGSGESVEITIEEVVEIEEVTPIEEAGVEEVVIAEVEAAPVVVEETRTPDEVMPAGEEEAPPLDE